MAETPQEAARTRRRWITIGEVIGILALLISAASLWDSREERTAKSIAAPVTPLVLTGSVAAEGERIDLRAAASTQVIQTQTLVFPEAVRADPVDTTGNARIEAGWFDAGLRRALGDGKGTGRLAVGIETRFVADGAPGTDRAVYDIGYRVRSRFLRPDAVEIEGVSLVRARVGGNLRAAVDARFAGQGSKAPAK